MTAPKGKRLPGSAKTEGSDALEKLVRALPKTDLHLHLDGSVELPRMIEIARRDAIKLPSYTVEGLNETLFKDSYANLEEYLATFGYSCAVMQKPENLEAIAYDLAIANLAEGVRYIEVRFAPQLHINRFMDMKRVLASVDKGLARAKKEFNARKAISQGLEPAFDYGIIVCALRCFGRLSEYYDKFIDSHPFSEPKSIFALCSFELSQGAVRFRDEEGIPIVGFDLAGAEEGFPAADHVQAFQYAHANFMHKTVHAGEAYGPESIFQAITDLHADRIGHGLYLFDTESITSKAIRDKMSYVENLAQFIADRRITIEVCLTSNMQTSPSIGRIDNHSFRQMVRQGLSTTICTDNRTVSKTTVTGEILKAVRAFSLKKADLKNLLIYGFKRSFFPGTYMSKRAYVRQVIDYCDKVFSQHPGVLA